MLKYGTAVWSKVLQLVVCHSGGNYEAIHIKKVVSLHDRVSLGRMVQYSRRIK